MANLKQFGRDTKLHEVLGDGDGEYVPPHILGIQGLKKACKKYKIRYSDATRSKVVAEVLAAQLRELGARGQAEEEDEEVSLPDSEEEEEEAAVVAVSRPKRVVKSPAKLQEGVGAGAGLGRAFKEVN